MNECFFLGKIVDIYNFKFIYNKTFKYKCIVKFKLELLNTEYIEILAFDELIDKVLINKFKFVYIHAELIENMNIRLKEIYEEENAIWKTKDQKYF